LEEAKGKWVDKLPHVLWMYRTTPRRSTGETPFSIMYGSEVVIPLEISFPTMRSNQFNSSSNEQLLSTNLDLAKEQREVANVKLAQYLQMLRQGYEKGIKVKTFVQRGLVLRRVVGNMKNPFLGKART